MKLVYFFCITLFIVGCKNQKQLCIRADIDTDLCSVLKRDSLVARELVTYYIDSIQEVEEIVSITGNEAEVVQLFIYSKSKARDFLPLIKNYAEIFAARNYLVKNIVVKTNDYKFTADTNTIYFHNELEIVFKPELLSAYRITQKEAEAKIIEKFGYSYCTLKESAEVEELINLLIPLNQYKSIPLSAIAEIRIVSVPNKIVRRYK